MDKVQRYKDSLKYFKDLKKLREREDLDGLSDFFRSMAIRPTSEELEKPILEEIVPDPDDIPNIESEQANPKWSVTEFPTLEITTVIPKKGCVVDCVFCPQEILKKSYNDEMWYMSMADFKRAIDKVSMTLGLMMDDYGDELGGEFVKQQKSIAKEHAKEVLKDLD